MVQLSIVQYALWPDFKVFYYYFFNACGQLRSQANHF